MNLLDRLFGKPNFFKLDDCYALDRQRLWEAISKGIVAQRTDDKLVVIVCHFPETFSNIQERLSQEEIEYQIPSSRLCVDSLQDAKKSKDNSVLLVLADLIDELPDERNRPPIEPAFELTVMVCERHPMPSKDRNIEKFCRDLPIPVRLGYFLALNDAIVELAINEMTFQLLKQMGLEEQELIASNMITKRLDKTLSRMERQMGEEVISDSAEEWIENNLDV